MEDSCEGDNSGEECETSSDEEEIELDGDDDSSGDYPIDEPKELTEEEVIEMVKRQ